MLTNKLFLIPAILCVGMVLFTSCGPNLPEEVAIAYEQLPTKLDYNLDVKPILSDKCFLCHGPDKNKREAGFRLDLEEVAYDELPETPGKYAIKPGNLNKSEVFHRIISKDHEYLMPTPESKLELTDYEKAVIIKWVEDGAEYKPHWAFIKPEKPKPPKVSDDNWVQNPIDKFVFQKAKNQGLVPSEEADKSLLLRRLSFDLTGLPPSAEELKSFVNDNSENAYEKQVDRLMASSHYGEKMAVDWLDLSRYADTHGYLVDRYRDMSPWRDWVIKSFNENKSYEQFVTDQLAGDLLENPKRDQILATGFNRLHPQNLEGGIIDEEFRVAYVSDRADVLGTGLMGLTVACAKCHDHKYDPISQKNYYELYSFFNNVNESGQISWDWAIPVPTLMIPNKKQEEILAYLEKEVKTQKESLDQIISQKNTKAEDWVEKEVYQKITSKSFPNGVIAHYELENASLKNRLNPRQKGKMDRRFSSSEKPVFTKGKHGKGLLLDGDAWLDLDKVGVFKRNQAFSISLEVNIPEELETGYIFHKGMGTGLHSYRGYHLYLKDNKLELLMAHTWPDNAIVEYATDDIPREEWVNFTVTYDGSSKAAGYKLFMNGQELSTEIEIDNLYKDIIFHELEDYIYPKPIEPGLQIGARWRGKGITGASVDDIMVYERELTDLEVIQIGNPNQFQAITSKDKTSLSDPEIVLLENYFQANFDTEYQKALAELEKKREAFIDSVENIQEVMVMKEMPERRKAYILERGLYDTYGEEVFPNTPESILSMPEDLPKNRLGLAKWLFHAENPLTARVAVNRYWQIFFGSGIVKTTEDFGNQGTLPSHPALLDWLAVNFVESGWDVKALVKQIVMSASYRQSSNTSEELREIDPDNVWLARGPSLRLSSEMIRDNALAVSNLLNPKIGGESVKPYQPDGLWKMNNAQYEQDHGNKLYRRSLYTLWKRSVPHPTLATFDVPDRSECTVRRQKTNTPLQALVLLNDPAFLEACKVIGEQISLAENQKETITNIFSTLTGRSPQAEEMGILLKIQEKEYQAFSQHQSKAKGWLSAGEYVLNQDLDPNLLAANAVLASVILNSDATITKR